MSYFHVLKLIILNLFLNLEQKYPNMCQLCYDPVRCGIGDKHWGRKGPLYCLTGGSGQVNKIHNLIKMNFNDFLNFRQHTFASMMLKASLDLADFQLRQIRIVLAFFVLTVIFNRSIQRDHVIG